MTAPLTPRTCARCDEDCHAKSKQLTAELGEANRRIADLEQRDDITMTAFGKLEAKFKAQVIRAEAAEGQLAEKDARIAELEAEIKSTNNVFEGKR